MSSLIGAEVDDLRSGRTAEGTLGCVATIDELPVALVNVYAVNFGDPSDIVARSAVDDGPQLYADGPPAVVVAADAGPTLQVASPLHLVTIQVMGYEPSRSDWAVAGEAALLRLPR